MSSPMELSLRRLRELGYEVDVCQRIIPKTNKKKDLFGFADIVAVHPSYTGTLYVQTTTGDNFAARIRKILESERARKCVMSRNYIQVHGWRKLKGRSGGKPYWDCKVRIIEAEDFNVL